MHLPSLFNEAFPIINDQIHRESVNACQCQLVVMLRNTYSLGHTFSHPWFYPTDFSNVMTWTSAQLTIHQAAARLSSAA